MKFLHVSLENWRNFRHVSIALQNRMFLVGPNASGKSNFLDVFRFLRDIVTPGGGFEQAIDSRGGVKSIRNLSARHPSTSVAVQVDIHEGEKLLWRYRLAFNHDNPQYGPVIQEEKVWRGNTLLLDRPNEEDQLDQERLRQTYLEQTIANFEFREIAEFFVSIHYYHLVPQLIRDPERSIGRRSDPYGGDFLEQIAATQKHTREARLRRILAALKIAVPQFSDLILEKDKRGVSHLKGNYVHWRPKGAWQTEADFSDGTLRLIGLLWSLLDGSGPILLEEPELSLHPEIVRHIPQMILSLRQGLKPAERQVFLSTHSSELLRDEGIAADEVVLFIPTKEGSEVKVGIEIDEVRQLLEAGLTVAEVVIPRTSPTETVQLSFLGD